LREKGTASNIYYFRNNNNLFKNRVIELILKSTLKMAIFKTVTIKENNLTKKVYGNK